MEASRPHTVSEVAQAPPRLSPRWWVRYDGDGDSEAGESQQERWRTTSRSALAVPSSIDVDEVEARAVGPDNAANEDTAYSSLLKTIIYVCSQVDLLDD